LIEARASEEASGPTRPLLRLAKRRAWNERVAQSVEHLTFNQGVLGSSPSALTNNPTYRHCENGSRSGSTTEDVFKKALSLSVEFGIVAEYAALVESDAPVALEITANARALRNRLAQSGHSRAIREHGVGGSWKCIE
jgi:hypothetical protein